MTDKLQAQIPVVKDRADQLLQEMEDRYAASVALDASTAFAMALREVESPIEQLMIAALLAFGRSIIHGDPALNQPPEYQGQLDTYFRMIPDGNMRKTIVPTLGGEWIACSEEDGALVVQQPIACGETTYRADLAIVGWADAPIGRQWKVAIECDGHDFHERTKEQARHDRRRDRAFQVAGWSILRFTGSEISADPLDCAYQVASFLAIRNAACCPKARADIARKIAFYENFKARQLAAAVAP